MSSNKYIDHIEHALRKMTKALEPIEHVLNKLGLETYIQMFRYMSISDKTSIKIYQENKKLLTIELYIQFHLHSYMLLELSSFSNSNTLIHDECINMITNALYDLKDQLKITYSYDELYEKVKNIIINPINPINPIKPINQDTIKSTNIHPRESTDDLVEPTTKKKKSS